MDCELIHAPGDATPRVGRASVVARLQRFKTLIKKQQSPKPSSRRLTVYTTPRGGITHTPTLDDVTTLLAELDSSSKPPRTAARRSRNQSCSRARSRCRSFQLLDGWLIHHLSSGTVLGTGCSKFFPAHINDAFLYVSSSPALQLRRPRRGSNRGRRSSRRGAHGVPKRVE